ncbi:MAG: SH3 domain-containing protein, partial [Coleofasciculus sp. C2-GNP5-27]
NDPNKWVDITSKYHWQQAYDSYKVIDFEVPNSGKYDLHFHLYEAGGDAYMDLAWGEVVGNFMVSGDFYNAYNNRRELGNPTSEVFDSGNGTFKQNFEHGYIFWNGQSAQVYQTSSGKPSQPSNSFQTGRVNSQVGSLPLRLRNEPSTIGTTTLDLLYQGTTFKIIRQVSSSDPNWHSWYEVEANGKHGYVAADYVDVISNNNSNNSPNPTPQPVIGSDFSGTVMKTGINVRSQPGVHNQQVDYVSPGTPLIFDAWTRSTSHRDGITNQWDNKWFRIKDTDTWVASAYIIGNPKSNTPYIEFPSNQSPQPNPNPQPQPQPISGMPDFSLPAYREDNLFWRSGYAPKSTNPPFTNLGNAKGNCTWYVNGRLQQLGYDPSILSNLTSNADRWDDQARAAGIYMSRTPQVGAIVQWESGHVAVVERVNSDGTILISESSYSPVSGSSYDYLYNTRTISAASPSTYIHVPSSEVSSGSNSFPKSPIADINFVDNFQISKLSNGQNKNGLLYENIFIDRDRFSKFYPITTLPGISNFPFLGNDLKIYKLRSAIKNSAKEYDVSPELVGAILFDELERRTWEDSLQDSLARISPGFVFEQDYSVGIAQMKPTTAKGVFESVMGYCPTKEVIVQWLIDDSKACKLVAAWIKKMINEWHIEYPDIQNRSDIIATLYSLPYRKPHSSPNSNDRGQEIANNMSRIGEILNYVHIPSGTTTIV